MEGRGAGRLAVVTCASWLFITAVAAACTSPQPGPSTTPRLLTSSPHATMEPATVVKNAQTAVAGLTSLEAHSVRIESGVGNDPSAVTIADYRYEPPNRHSYVIRFPEARTITATSPGGFPEGYEAIRIGEHYWSRRGLAPAGPWACETYDVVPPDIQGYAPANSDGLVGLVQSTLGSAYVFRKERQPDDDGGQSAHLLWIDPQTFLPLRVETTWTSSSGSEVDIRIIDSYNSPTQITAPGPCNPSPTPTDMGSEE